MVLYIISDVNSTSLDSVKTEPRFKLPGTTSTKKNNDIEEQCNQQCAQQWTGIFRNYWGIRR